MYSRHSTPPATSYNYIPGSVGSDVTYYSQESSPAPNVAPTPPRSPVRQLGPTLLPKVRTQDQVAEPTAGPIRHRRTTSAASTVSYGYSPYSRPVSQSYRESSPYTHNNMISPVSNGSCDFNGLSMLNSPITFTPSEGRRASSYAPTHSRSSSVNASRHARSTSTNSIDESMISRYGFPTYRNIPNYVTAPSAPQSTFVTSPVEYSQLQQPPSYTAQALDFPLLDFEPAPAVQYPSFTEQPSLQPSLQPSFDAYQPVATSSLLEYLSGPNPSPALVRRVTAAPRGIHNHFWWDVRNLRSWEDFNIAAIKEIPSILPLLEVPVSQSYLPQPSRQNMQPEHEAALHDICTNYYANKVNAALKIAQGTSHMQMRAIKPAPGARDQPQFVSSYPSDFEKTLFGDVRGRVVGLVKCYDNWNTGMRSESAPKQVLYLQGLAHLQRVMREHGCRYGFIMTEIELLCVRAGGDFSTPDPTTFNAAAGMPIFGYLELSAPISLATSGASASGDVQLTASLALWYLHMLAKENPFEGMGTWRMEVGGPAALSRQNHLEKDAWIPKPQLGEKREAKRVRGWVFPEEPLSKRECGKGRRGKSVG